MKYSAAIRNRFEQAVVCFGKAEHERAHALCQLDRHPEHGDALHLLGVICLRNGRATEAADWLRRALDNNTDQAEIHLSLGNALRETGRHEEAAERFMAAVTLQPGHARALNNKGTALFRLFRN